MDKNVNKIEIVEPDKARKRNSLKSIAKKASKRTNLYSAPGLPKKPSCVHYNKSLKCGTLTSNDIFHFHKNFYKFEEKISQDNFILQHVTIEAVKRRRPRGTSKSKCRNYSIKYFITNRKKSNVPVCSKAFAEILRIKASRIQGVTKRFFHTGTTAKENRGGDRKRFLFASRKEAVQNFICKFQPLESHYSRGKIKHRVYLPPDLNIKIMHCMYNDEALPDFEVKIGFFRKVFNTSFNIGFGSPRTDVCSTCLQLLESLRMTNNCQEKQNIRTQYRIHMLRAKAFFKYLRDDNPKVQIISFDCQKNLPLPKIPDQSAYYARQLYVHNFTVVVGTSHESLTPQNVHSYVWTEELSGKGSNEICTSVYHCLNSLNLDGKEIVRLVADGCGGQNKNSMVVAMAMKWFEQANHSISEIQIIFPVTGHSFIPPDRVFALTEKKIRQKECIVQPEEYYEIMSEHATIHCLVKDIQVLDWKSKSKEYLKRTQSWHFQISKCKRIILERTSQGIRVRGEISYRNDFGVKKSVLKMGKRLSDFQPETVRTRVPVKEEKLKDVENLLKKHYGENWRGFRELEFYKRVLDNEGERDINVPENEDILNNSENYLMDEVLDFV